MSYVNRVVVFVSGSNGSLCGNPEVLDDGTLCKDLLKRLEEVVAVYWECTRPQCIRDLKGFSVFLSGGGRRNGQGESVLVCDLMKQWLLHEQVPESCIHIDNSFLTCDAASVRALWRYMQRYECVEKTMVYIVAQAHHALLLENLLNFISQGKCLNTIRGCRYGNLWSMSLGVLKLFSWYAEDIRTKLFQSLRSRNFLRG
ncbi:MAG: hypothetical protein IPJ67_02165 [Candidatus Moraniibacteriota bacterium]|nr:MAG: hypothetical protein IPJ67_02165 [Candidatus Moranbacteria bacterium]